MTREFTENDRGLPVRTAEGEEVGTVSEISEGGARVDPTEDLNDDIRTNLGWEESEDSPYDLRDQHIDQISDDEVRLGLFESGPDSEAGP